MGNKLGTYFTKKSRESLGINEKDLVNVVFSNGRDSKDYMTRFSKIISFRKNLIEELCLKEGDKVKFNIEIIGKTNYKNRVYFKDGKIDILGLVPDYTDKGSKIVSRIFSKGNEEWIMLWSYHNRGSSYQIEIKRFIDPNIFGKILGQLQAEGTKNGDGKRLEFSNKSIKEHTDFICCLNHLGVKKKNILVKFNYHPDFKNLEEEVKKFKKSTMLDIGYLAPNPQSKGNFGFHTFVRSTLFYNLIMNALDVVRKELINKKWNHNLKLLANGFLSKLLSGDGNIELIRNKNTLSARIKITDCNTNFLKFYKSLMERYGFKPKITEKHYYVRSYLSPDLAKVLVSIGAFEGNRNRKKIDNFLETRA